jgi:predicted transporter
MKIIVFILNALIQLAVAAFGLFMLLVGLNGFSERQATPGLLFYMILSALSAFLVGAASAFAARWLTAKFSLGKFAAAAIAVPLFAVTGAVILVIALFAAVFLAQALG